MNKNKHIILLGTMASLITVACWGAMPVFLRYLKDHIDSPWTMNMYRYGFAGFLYLFVLYYYHRKGCR